MSVSEVERFVDAWKLVPGRDTGTKVNYLHDQIEQHNATGGKLVEDDLPEAKRVPCPKCKIMALCKEYHPGYPAAYDDCVQRRTSQ